jgi:hypothetical protein
MLDHSSWINQVEVWFAEIQRDVIADECSRRWLIPHEKYEHTFASRVCAAQGQSG